MKARRETTASQRCSTGLRKLTLVLFAFFAVSGLAQSQENRWQVTLSNNQTFTSDSLNYSGSDLLLLIRSAGNLAVDIDSIVRIEFNEPSKFWSYTGTGASIGAPLGCVTGVVFAHGSSGFFPVSKEEAQFLQGLFGLIIGGGLGGIIGAIVGNGEGYTATFDLDGMNRQGRSVALNWINVHRDMGSSRSRFDHWQVIYSGDKRVTCIDLLGLAADSLAVGFTGDTLWIPVGSISELKRVRVSTISKKTVTGGFVGSASFAFIGALAFGLEAIPGMLITGLVPGWLIGAIEGAISSSDDVYNLASLSIKGKLYIVRSLLDKYK